MIRLVGNEETSQSQLPHHQIVSIDDLDSQRNEVQMCYFTAIGIKPKFEDKLNAVKSSYKVKPCKNSTITSYSDNFRWFWIYDKKGHCSCDLFIQKEEIIKSLSIVVSESFSINLINHFFNADPDDESFEFSERKIDQDLLESTFEIPDDVMLKIVKKVS